MINLKMYGKRSSAYEYVKMMVIRQAEKAGIELNIVEINDLESIIAEELESIPTIKVNNHIDLRYNSKDDINAFVRELNTKILKEENYGLMKKILVPIDFSETSENACAFAMGLSKDLNGVIKVVHSYIPKALNMEGAVYLDPEIEKLRREQLDKFVENLNHSWIGETETYPLIDKEFVTGFAGTEIPDMTKGLEDSIVVIGSTGSGGSFKTIFGSVSTLIANNAHCPVFVVPLNANYGPFKKIAYAADDLHTDSQIIDDLIYYANVFQSELCLVHVDSDENTEELDQLKAKFIEKAPDLNICTHHIEAEGVVYGLDKFIEEKNIELLVMTKQKRGFLNSLFHSSITRRMTINTKIPLLVLHR